MAGRVGLGEHPAAPVAIAVAEHHRLSEEPAGTNTAGGSDKVRGALGAQPVAAAVSLCAVGGLLQRGDLGDHRIGGLPVQRGKQPVPVPHIHLDRDCPGRGETIPAARTGA
jgi:hypothetical protein